MAAEPVQLPTSGSLAGILDVLEIDEDFRALISGEIEVPESDIDPSITVGIPEGLRPALAAGASGTTAGCICGGLRPRSRRDGRDDSFVVFRRSERRGTARSMGDLAS